MNQDLMMDLIEIRINKGIRQVDVAKSMGMGQPAISELESGKTTLRLDILQKYAKAVGMKIVWRLEDDS